MPNIVVYVPAAKWRALEAEGEDPAAKVRQLASDALDRHLAGSIEGSRTLVPELAEVPVAEQPKGAGSRDPKQPRQAAAPAEVRTDFKQPVEKKKRR